MDASAEINIRFIASMAQLPAQAWDALCGDDYPFTRHAFLQVLEQSDSVSTQAGWQPQHLLLEQGGQLIAAVPLYIKSHSYGEYVFDWAWADAYQRYGLAYYPKLVAAIPFTPCTGSRILCAQPERLPALIPAIVEAIAARAQQLQASSWHCLFPGQALSDQLAEAGALQRLGCQFHWFNRGYSSWDDFVARMHSRKRKNINKERRHLQQQGIEFAVKEGAAISAQDWQWFYQLYTNTYHKRSGHSGYLTQAFFQLIGEQLGDAVVMIVAQHQQRDIAAALYFKDATTIYGRYWGCVEEYAFLHFETCYYQGIDYAIRQGLQRFDGGAQGEHKIQRGFEPVITYSNHWLARPEFQQAIAGFLAAETESMLAYVADAKSYLPFKEPDKND